MLAGELGAQRAHGGHDHDLELVWDLAHEGADLLHEAVHAALATGLEESGDGQCGDAAVHVGDQVLKVQIAGGDGCRVRHGNLKKSGKH